MRWQPRRRRSLFGAIVAALVVSSTVVGAVGAAPAQVEPHLGGDAQPVTDGDAAGSDGVALAAGLYGPSAPPDAVTPAASSPSTESGDLADRVTDRGAAPGSDGNGTDGLDVDPEDIQRHEVTLITGQTVTVIEAGNRTRYRVDGDANLQRISTPRGTYVFPAGVNFSRLDPALFNVDLLVEQNVTDAERSTIPVIVEYDRSAVESGPDDLAAMGRRLDGFSHARTLTAADATAGGVRKSAAGEHVRRFAASPAVERIVYDRQVSLDLDRSTEIVGSDDARRRYAVSGEGVRVAVVDTGIDTSHPDLDDGAVVAAKDFTGENVTGRDPFGHGTHVAGIVAGDGDANGEYVGVAPDADLLNARVFEESGNSRTSWIVDAVEWSVRNDADVVSMSLGSGATDASDPLTEAVTWARERGAVVVVSAGNGGPAPRTIGSPGIADAAITVGATGPDGHLVSDFSSRGPTAPSMALKPDLVAPGTSIASACVPDSQIGCDPDLDGPYVEADGTSMSAPHVSGAVALVLDEHPDWSATRVENALGTTADPLVAESETAVYAQGAGMLNVTEAIGTDVVVSNATMTIDATGETERRVLTVTNVGDEIRTLETTVELRDTETGTALNDSVSTNRSTLELSPGESADLALRTDTGVDPGTYGGRVTFTRTGSREVPAETGGREYSVVFGFSIPHELTVEKAPVDGTSVEDDRVMVLPNSSFDPGFYPLREASTHYLDDETEFTVETYSDDVLIWSWGQNEDTGTPIATHEVVDLDADADGRVVLDEGDTVSYSLDTSGLSDRYDSLEPVVVEPRLQLDLFSERCEQNGRGSWTSSCNVEITPPRYRTVTPDSTEVRYSPSPAANASVEYVLVPERYRTSGDLAGEDPRLDSPVFYRLQQASVGIDGDRTYRPDQDALETVHRRIYRSGGTNATDDVRFFSFADTVRWPDAGGRATSFDLGNQTNHTVYRSPDVYYDAYFEGENPVWGSSTPSFEGTLGETGVTRTRAINRHPYTLTVYSLLSGGNYFYWEPTDGEPFGYRALPFGIPENDTHTIRLGGEVVSSGAGDYVRLAEPEPGTSYEVTATTRRPANYLSTRLNVSLEGTYRPEGDTRPPAVDLRVEDLNFHNQVIGGNVSVVVNATDRRSSIGSVGLWYAPPSVDSPPDWSELGDGLDCERTTTDGWTKVCLRPLGDGRYRGEFAPAFDEGRIHLAGLAGDTSGNVYRFATFHATEYLAERPNTPPSATTGSNRTVSTGSTVTLDASGSTDPEGDALSYDWAQVGGPAVSLADADTATPEFTAPAVDRNRTLTFAVTVDDGRDTDVDTVAVTVLPENDRPVAETGPNRTIAEPSTVTLDATNSTDPDGDALSYDWEQVGGSDVTLLDDDTATPVFTAPESERTRTYEFAVTVDDGRATDVDTVAVTVRGSAGDDWAGRSLSSTEAPVGGSLTATLTAEFDSAHERVSILDGYEGPVAGATITSLTVDGEAVPDDDVVFSDAGDDSLSVALEDVPADATVEVTYRVDLASDAEVGETVRFVGSSDNPDVGAGDRTGEFGVESATVVEASSPVDRADADGDGDIDDSELRAAIVGWSSGEYSDADLRSIVVEWSS